MQSDPRFARYSTITIAVSALAGAIAAASATLGVPIGAIVLSEMCAFACVVAFTLLIWAAIEDGKQPDRAPAE